ncbi:MAG: protein-L-isoaspartate O-methyltransferase [Spirochaetaceae bacterium]|jgi:protein-L-isoaspartate(D-aspartate) O-methyltransferase|nr:protein-L-isoaspartate O-methyltransferase [Spirochaetaceae bacterium]
MTFKRTISLSYIAVLLCGVFAGAVLGGTIPKAMNAKTEKALSWNDLGIKTAAEEDAATVSVQAETANTKATFDGPKFAAGMPTESKAAWLEWIMEKRPDLAAFVDKRWKLANDFIASGELKRTEDVRAFLLTPRESFVRSMNKGKEYEDTWLPIGWGATITDPDVVAMMTTTLNIQTTDRVLEIGTGSGYQSAILSYLSSNVYTIEIIKPLFAETDNLYRSLEETNPAYSSIHRKLGDGYYGWEEFAPFDKIIVTCSIDHIPPPLLKQLKPGGIMVLPLGPPGRQYIMEVKKNEEPDGSVSLTRRDVYNGLWVSFIPFRNEAGSSYTATKNK